MSEIPKKKRGRKPKNNIINNPTPVFDSNSLDDILITCIKKPKNVISVDDNIKRGRIIYEKQGIKAWVCNRLV